MYVHTFIYQCILKRRHRETKRTHSNQKKILKQPIGMYKWGGRLKILDK